MIINEICIRAGTNLPTVDEFKQIVVVFDQKPKFYDDHSEICKRLGSFNEIVWLTFFSVERRICDEEHSYFLKNLV